MMGLGWLVEFVLESAGAFIYFRRNKLLCFILSFCAVTDFLAACFQGTVSHAVLYGRCGWVQYALKELMLVWLACQICGMFVAEQNRLQVRATAAFISLGTCALVMVAFFTADGLKERLLNGEIAANVVLMGIIFLGWLGRRDLLSKEWQAVTLGFLVMIIGDILVSALSYFWVAVQNWQAAPTIAGQIVWLLGPYVPHKLPCARAGLGQRVQEAERISVC